MTSLVWIINSSHPAYLILIIIMAKIHLNLTELPETILTRHQPTSAIQVNQLSIHGHTELEHSLQH